jgi:hypothetical protein
VLHVDKRFGAVLKKVYAKLSQHDIAWAITGSLNFALHGLPVEVHDIDIQTDKNGAYEIEQLFAEFMTKKVARRTGKYIRSYLGAFVLDGITVEVMGDIEKRLESGEWGEPVNVCDHRETITYEGMTIPVLSLEYEEKAYRQIGRIDTAEMLRKYLKGRA